ncbi:hypothetical protein [Klebsiella pneumoniae]|uniref:hypothetical protein n=1 Tax=Klebsiella pneumoniae TaxID=573 RepID=UPI002118C3E9|nr:hypothetical protein [Klebsiella pneumoniae]MCQ8734576.1 hypothetical protein [Klebsiella pneumoniae]
MTDITELAKSLKAEDVSPERMEWLKKLADMEYCASNPGHWLMSLKETNYLAVVALQCLEKNLALVEALEKAQQRIAELESRTVKLPDELSGETLLDNYSDVVYSDDTGVLEYTNIIGCFVKITAPPDKVIRFRWSNEGMHIRLVDRVKTHEHAGIIVDFPKNYNDFIQ